MVVRLFRTHDASKGKGGHNPDLPNGPGPAPKTEQKDDKQSNGLSDLEMKVVESKYGEEAQKQIRDFRYKIDSIFLTVKTLPPNRETSLAITSFQSARQFCGIMLGERGGNFSPQNNPLDQPGTPKIQERSEKGEVLEDVVNELQEIEKLKMLRLKAEDVITDFCVYIENTPYQTVKEFVAQNNALSGLLSGKMWLGERLVIIATAAQESK